jgi:hypothetical protein
MSLQAVFQGIWVILWNKERHRLPNGAVYGFQGGQCQSLHVVQESSNDEDLSGSNVEGCSNAVPDDIDSILSVRVLLCTWCTYVTCGMIIRSTFTDCMPEDSGDWNCQYA